MDAAEYKHVVLGLIFLKYISDAFEAKRAALLEEELADPEDPEEYLAENVFWVPKEARWSHLQANAKQPTVGKLIHDAMLAIEAKKNRSETVKPQQPWHMTFPTLKEALADAVRATAEAGSMYYAVKTVEGYEVTATMPLLGEWYTPDGIRHG